MNPGKLHKKQFGRLLKMMGEPIIIRQPAATQTPSNNADKVLGARDRETAIGNTLEVTALWRNGHGTLLDEDKLPSGIAALGRAGNIDAVIRVLLDDVLVDPNNKFSRTLVDTAIDIVYQNNSFKVLTTDRTGLPLEGPYILWAALRKSN